MIYAHHSIYESGAPVGSEIEIDNRSSFSSFSTEKKN